MRTPGFSYTAYSGIARCQRSNGALVRPAGDVLVIAPPYVVEKEHIDKLVNTLYLLLSAAIGVWALRRYLFLLTRAEVVANQAQCEDCGEYGRFKVVADHRSSDETEVCCRKCRHHWMISTCD